MFNPNRLRTFQCAIENNGGSETRYLEPVWRIAATFDPKSGEGTLAKRIEELEERERVRVTKVIDEYSGKEIKP